MLGKMVAAFDAVPISSFIPGLCSTILYWFGTTVLGSANTSESQDQIGFGMLDIHANVEYRKIRLSENWKVLKTDTRLTG